MSHAFRNLFPDAVALDNWPHHPLSFYFGKLRERGVNPSQVTILTLLRDPMCHLVSMYHYWRQKGDPLDPNVRLAKQLSFEDFCRHRLSPIHLSTDLTPRRPGDYRACLAIDGKIPGNVVYIRLEHWREDIQKLNYAWASKLQVERMNPSLHDDAMSYFNETTIRLLRERCAWAYDEGYYPEPRLGASGEPHAALDHSVEAVDTPTRPAVALPEPSMIFVTGTEGSGTDLVLKLLASPAGACTVGNDQLSDNHEARVLVQEFESVSRELRNRALTLTESHAVHARWHHSFNRIRQSPAFAGKSRFILNCTFPMNSHEGRPDLWALPELDPDYRIIVVYREPLVVCHNAFINGYDTDLRRLAQAEAEQLSILACQVTAIGPRRVRVSSFERLCANPVDQLTPLFTFCGLPLSGVADAAALVGPDCDRPRLRELDTSTLSWLRCFFHPGRRRQWAVLEESAASAG